MEKLKEIYDYRELLKTNVKKDIRGKYKASFLGVLWSFINPLLMVLVYAIVFPYIMRIQTENYLIFLICGVIPWNFFTQSVMGGATSITVNANLIKKVYFPREILPLSTVTSGLVNFLISNIIILIFVLAGGLGITWHLVFLPIIIIIQYIFSLGLAFIVSALNVYVKDVEYMVNFLVMLAFYATPVLYETTMFSGPILWLFRLNPMAHLINAYRDIFIVHQIPQMGALGILLIISIVFMLIGYNIFKKLERGFAEEV